MAAGNVGVIHPFSAGLGVVLHVAHGLGNCLALNVLGGHLPPKNTKQFRTMIERQGVSLPTGICKDLTEEQYDGLYRGCIVHEKPLTTPSAPASSRSLPRKTSSNATRASSGGASGWPRKGPAPTTEARRPLPQRQLSR